MNPTNNKDMLNIRLVKKMINEKMSVGERIRYYRTLRGMSQEMLALEANINTAFVGHLERGLKSPTVTTLEKITNALGISLEELFSENLSKKGRYDRKQAAMDHVEFMFRSLSGEEAEQMAEIVRGILKLKEIL